MTPTEPFDAEELWGMTSAQLGQFLGLVFGLHCCMRLTIERDCMGEVLIDIEDVAPGKVPGATIPDMWPGFPARPWKNPALSKRDTDA